MSQVTGRPSSLRSSRKGSLFSFRKPSTAALGGLVGEQREEEFSYPDVGATRASLPTGYRHVGRVVELGRGEAVFLRAVEGLRGWQAHLRAGVELNPGGARLEEGHIVALAVRVAPLYVTVACRVVYVSEHPGRFAFAYGTLPHHVIEGEEAFVVKRDDSDVIRFAIAAFFRPRGRALRSVGPLVHVLDQRLVSRYLRGMQQHVAREADGAG